MNDAFVIQIKNLAVELAETGVKYAIESLADWVIPRITLESAFKTRDGSTEVVRTITFEDGTTFDIIVKLRSDMVEKILSKSDSYIPTFNSFVYKFEQEEDPCKKSFNSVSVQVMNTSNTRGGVSILNGILGINW